MEKPQLVRQWADWALYRLASESYELVRGEGLTAYLFQAEDDQAALKESARIVRKIDKPES